MRTRKVAEPKPKADDSEDEKVNDKAKDDKSRRGGLSLARAGPSDMSNYVPAKHFEEIKTKMAKEIEELQHKVNKINITLNSSGERQGVELDIVKKTVYAMENEVSKNQNQMI